MHLVRTRDGSRVPLLVAERALCADGRAALQAISETGNLYVLKVLLMHI